MARVKQFNEEEVLQKAVELFWKQGYNATSMDDLVNYLGINRASLYDTFGGKKELFKKALNKYLTDNRQWLYTFLHAQKSVKEGLCKFFRMVVTETMQDQDIKGCFAVNTSTELLPHDAEMCEILQKNKLNFEKLFFELLKKGQDNKELRKDMDLKATAAYLVAFFNGLKVMAKLKPAKKDLEATIKIGLSVLD